ncbi:MAG: glycosyltransferase 87 family protein [Flavobacteriales bacterium]|jgi:hypothetical protein|nr:glycosyltransferase 87 family protein [Flavobacteriales bacterium]MCB0758735.1 DUF2029 domain-containing protein [Flavobacteriales bacterium]
MMGTRAVQRIAPLLLLAAAVLFLGHGPSRSQSLQLLLGFSTAFTAYLWADRKSKLSWKQLMVAAIMLRVLLFLAPITWTDDQFRYIWDGLCSVHGISPFAFTPAELLALHPQVFTPALFAKLNSPHFHSVYPPVAQLVFMIAAGLGQGDAWHATLVLRIVAVAFDLATIGALGVLLKDAPDRVRKVGLYALNPLVLMEFTVNLHSEVLMIAPCLWAVHLFRNKRYAAAAVLIAIAAAAKLWPLIFLAWIPSQLGWRRSIRFLTITLLVFVASWIPFYTPEFFAHFGSSLKLYVSWLEFNGALFEGLRRLLGDALVKGTGLLSAITLIGLAAYTLRLWRTRRTVWPEAMLWLLAIYLFGAQAVQPWYILPLVPLAALTGWRWPLLWTLLIVPTYLTYGTVPYEQPYWWIPVEYLLLLAFMAWEMWRRNKQMAFRT